MSASLISQPTTGVLTAVAVLGGLAVLLALARLVRHLLSIASNLLSSAGAAVAVLVTLLGTGTALITAIVLYVANH